MTTATPLSPLTDFSDRLSPMVVKELRQGLRTRAFGSVMLGMHLLLICITLISGAANNADDVRWMLDGLSTLALCVLVPLRGSSALADEIKRNTLDMLVLTRLSAGRIVFGKWASIAAQTGLLAVSIMPYVVARYVFGGANLFDELSDLGLKWLGGVVVAAMVVCVSTLRQAWVRSLIIMVPVFMMFSLGLSMYVMMSVGRSARVLVPFSGIGVLMVLLAVAVAAWAVFTFLSVAATRIAPPASLLSAIKRPVHLGVFLTLIAAALWTREQGWLALATVVGVAGALDAMTEPLNEIPSVYAPFYRRGLAGRLAGGLFAPGWATGFALSVMMGGLYTGTTYVVQGVDRMLEVWLGICTFWLVAALVYLVAGRRARDFLGWFVGGAILLGMVTGMVELLAMGARAGSDQPVWLLCVLPTTAMDAATTLAQVPAGARMTFQMAALMCAAVWPVLLAILSLRAWRWLKPVREEARQMQRP